LKEKITLLILIDIDKNDPNQLWLMYFDAVNSYDYAMSQKLPTGNFKWVKDIDDLDKMIRSSTYEKGSTGYILNVEIIVPKHLNFKIIHLRRKIKISTEQLSEYSKQLQDRYTETTKLLLDCTDKTIYTIDIKNLLKT